MMTQAAMTRTNPTPASPARQEPQTPSKPLLFPPPELPHGSGIASRAELARLAPLEATAGAVR